MATQSDGGDLTRPEPVREAGYRAAEQGADCTGSDALRLAHRNSASRRRRAARSPPTRGPSTISAVAQASALAQLRARTVTEAAEARNGAPYPGSMVCERLCPRTSTR